MAYEFDKMSINGTQIDAKDKAARDKIAEMIPDLESTKTTAQNALNATASQAILIADNADNIDSVRDNLQAVTETVNRIVSDEYQELDYTLQPNFTMRSYGYITAIRSGTLAVISFYALTAVNTSTDTQGVLTFNGFRAKKPVVTTMFNNTDNAAGLMRTNNAGDQLLAVRTTANRDYSGMIIFPIEEV